MSLHHRCDHPAGVPRAASRAHAWRVYPHLMIAPKALVAAVAALVLRSSVLAAGDRREGAALSVPELEPDQREGDGLRRIRAGEWAASIPRRAPARSKQNLEGRVVRFYFENPKGRSHAEIFANYRGRRDEGGLRADLHVQGGGVLPSTASRATTTPTAATAASGRSPPRAPATSPRSWPGRTGTSTSRCTCTSTSPTSTTSR